MGSRTRYIPSLVMLSAGFVACVITITQDYSTKDILLISTGTMVVFLILGFLIKIVADKYLLVSTVEETEEEAKEDENGQETPESKENSRKTK